MTNATVLIADSDAFQQQLVDMLLAADHYTLVPVKTGLEALTYLRDNTPELAILANNLPDMKGTDLCARMKGISRLRYVPVVVISSEMQHSATKELAAAVKADLVLAKPLGDKGLRGHVSDLLEKAEAVRVRQARQLEAEQAILDQDHVKLPAKADELSSYRILRHKDAPETSAAVTAAAQGINEADLLAEIHQAEHQLTIETDMHVIGLGESYPQPHASQTYGDNVFLAARSGSPIDAFAAHADDPPETKPQRPDLLTSDYKPETNNRFEPQLADIKPIGSSRPEAAVEANADAPAPDESDPHTSEAPLKLSLEVSADELVGRSSPDQELDLKASAAALRSSQPPAAELPDELLRPAEAIAPVVTTSVSPTNAATPAKPEVRSPQAETSHGEPEAVPFKVTDPRPGPHAAELELLRTQVEDLLNENEQLKAALEELESGKPMMSTFSYLDAIEELETLRRLTEHQVNQLNRVHQENRALRAEVDGTKESPKPGIWERLRL